MSKKIKLSFSIILVIVLVSGYFLWQINKHGKVADKVPSEQESVDKVPNEQEAVDKVPDEQEIRFIGGKQVQIVYIGFSASAKTFDINFTPGRSYNVVVGGEGQRGRFLTPLRIYRDSYCYFQTELHGDQGAIYMADIRGDGMTDLVVRRYTGSSGTTVDFRIIGDNGSGIGILADLSTLEESIRCTPTEATIVDLSGKVGIEYKRAGTWPTYRVDLVWDQKKKKYIAVDIGRVTPFTKVPDANKTIYFSVKEGKNGYPRIYYYDGNNPIENVTMKPGETLLIKRDPAMNQEQAIVGNIIYKNGSIVDLDYVEGSFFVTAIEGPGQSEIMLSVPHNHGLDQAINITVEP